MRKDCIGERNDERAYGWNEKREESAWKAIKIEIKPPPLDYSC